MLSPECLREKFRIKDPLIRNLLAEVFGTFLLCFIGISIVAQTVLSHGNNNTWININVGWGFAIVFSVQAVWNISGGHLNPAISVMMWTYGKIPALHILLYTIAQVVGAFMGALGTYIEYYDAIKHFENVININGTEVGVSAAAKIFATYPADFLSMTGGFVDQFVGTGMLALCVAIIVDHRNKIPHAAGPLYLGFCIMMIGTAFGLNVGYPINPARDFGPRLFTFLIWGSEVFTYPNCMWWLIPVTAPVFGAVTGAWIYQLFAGCHIPDDKEEYVGIELDDTNANGKQCA